MDAHSCSFSNKKSRQQNEIKTKQTHSTMYKDGMREVFNKLNQEFRTEYNTTITKQVNDHLKLHKPPEYVRWAQKRY